jgi:hypothetical protein
MADDLDMQPEIEDDAPARDLHPLVRNLIWLALVVAFIAWTFLAKVHTHLGVKAVEWDKNGREHVWRVWWRARDDIIDSDSSACIGLYTILILAFIALSMLALGVALVADEPARPRPHDE